MFDAQNVIRRRSLVPAALLGLLLAAAGLAQEIPAGEPPLPAVPAKDLPNVRLISLGGTISGTATERLNITNYGAPRLSPEEWIAALPELASIAHVTPEDLREPEDERSELVSLHWMKVARRLQELAGDDSVDGIVVTHGTNVMAEVAYFMNLVVDIRKPVVFVGSQRPWTGLSGDGPLNLYNAVRVAAAPEAASLGVLHAMNQDINTARDVTKSSAYRVHTFQGVDLGKIGVVDPDVVKLFMKPVRRHTWNSEFNIARLPDRLPVVEVLYAYTDAPGYLVDSLLEHGVEGIVIDGVGAGSLGSFADAVERAQAAGVVVVATARTHGGRVQATPRRLESQVVPGDNLVPEKARILLQLALTETTDIQEISRIFNEY